MDLKGVRRLVVHLVVAFLLAGWTLLRLSVEHVREADRLLEIICVVGSSMRRSMIVLLVILGLVRVFVLVLSSLSVEIGLSSLSLGLLLLLQSHLLAAQSPLLNLLISLLFHLRFDRLSTLRGLAMKLKPLLLLHFL